MNWEQRLQGMLLASGALAATACGGSTTAKAGIDADAASDDATAETGNTCCNASGDPCCSLTCTEGPPPASYDACELGQQQCEAIHGTFTLWSPDWFTCEPPQHRPSPSEAGVDDVGTPDAGLVDATEYAALDAAAESADADLVDAGADADSCPPSGGCTAACVAGRHNVTVMVDGCPVTECCVPDDAGTD
jgi:hypothetical protein